MGNSNSAELLDVPLQSPEEPIQSLDVSWITEAPTKLHIKAGAGANAVVTDLTTNKVVYTLKGKTFSYRTFLKDPHGEILVTLTRKSLLSKKYRMCPGDQTETEAFVIQDITGIFKTMILVGEFVDRNTDNQCRVAITGTASARMALCYLGLGSPSLSELGNVEDFKQNQDRYLPIGRIKRGRGGLIHEEYSIDAAANVDLTLLLLMWHVRYEYLRAERNNNNNN